MRPVYSTRAREDIDAIVLYYDEQQVGIAEHFLGALAGTIEMIREFPYQFREIEGGVRRAVFPRPFRFNLYYYPDRERDQFVILAVTHQSRHPDAWKRNE